MVARPLDHGLIAHSPPRLTVSASDGRYAAVQAVRLGFTSPRADVDPRSPRAENRSGYGARIARRTPVRTPASRTTAVRRSFCAARASFVMSALPEARAEDSASPKSPAVLPARLA